MSNPIIVGVDFEERSTPQILQHGYLQGRALGQSVLLVHVVEPIERPDQADQDTRAFHDQLVKKAENQMTGLAEQAPDGVSVSTCVELGPRVEVLSRLAAERGAVMLVLGSPFRGGPPVGIGLQILARCNCPVLIIPHL